MLRNNSVSKAEKILWKQVLSRKQIGEAKTNTLSNEYNFLADNPEIFENNYITALYDFNGKFFELEAI